MTPMPEQVELEEGSWDDLLDFLDPERPKKQGPGRNSDAEARYFEITRKLVCFFAGRGCRDPEDLAATTILRVAAKCHTVDCSGYEDRTGYFYGVARNVLHEAQRSSARDVKTGESLRLELLRMPPPDPEAWKEKEAVERCLAQCLARLTPRPRRLLMSYYRIGGGEAKIDAHRSLADKFGKSLNALRIEVHRARKALRECVFACLNLCPE